MSGRRAAAIAAALLLLLFAIDAGLVAAGLTAPIDARVLVLLRRSGQPGVASVPGWAVATARQLTWLGAGPARGAVTLAGAAWLGWRGRARTAWAYLLAVASAAAALPLLKHLFGRARPPVPWHLVAEHDLSFPSGHAFGSAVTYALLGAVLGGRGGAAAGAALAAAIGLTRILLGVHWTSDVVGGWLLGAAWVAAALALRAGAVERGGKLM